MDFSIREVRTEDAESIVELLNPIIRVGTLTVMDEPTTVRDQLEFIGEFPARGVYHAAIQEDGSRVLAIQDVGSTATSGPLSDVGEVSTFVALDARRKGIGRSLSEVTFEAARQRGFRKLRATIRADNPDAVEFYVSLGFRVTGTAKRHTLVGGRFVDLLLTEKLLGPTHPER